MSGLAQQSRTSTTVAPATTSTTSVDTSSNQANLQEMGLDGGVCEDTSAEVTQLPEPASPYVILERGAGANEGAVPGWQMVVETLLFGWSLPFDASRVCLGDIGAASETCEPVIALTWDSAWGPLPSMVDMPRHLSPLDARVAVTLASASDGWSTLDAAYQGQLTSLLGGETNTLSRAARRHVQMYLSDPGWSTQPAEAQANILRDLLSESDARPALVDEPHPDIEPAAHSLTGPVLEAGHAFRGVAADADVWTVTFTEGGHTVTIYAPHAPDPTAGHHYTVQQAVHALVRLPAANRAVVHTITLNAARNPDDAYWAVEYGDPNFESFMTAGAAGDVTIYPSQGGGMTQGYTDDTMVHETGHSWSRSQWGDDTSAAAWQPWRDAMARDRISVSNYATASIDEDVAETVQVFNTSKGTPQHAEYRAMVPARFAILDRYF